MVNENVRLKGQTKLRSPTLIVKTMKDYILTTEYTLTEIYCFRIKTNNALQRTLLIRVAEAT